MSKITSKQRNGLLGSQFGLPAQRKYPVDTAARAENAKARATQQEAKGNLSASQKAQIDKKANQKLYGSSKAPKGRK